MIERNKPLLVLVMGVATALSMAACNRAGDTETAGQKLDRNVAEARQNGEEAKMSAERTADKVGTALDDSAITASVKAKLAADSQLSALDIQVSTDHGHVVLTGKTSTDAARAHATAVAASVDGVLAVENKLALVGSKS